MVIVFSPNFVLSSVMRGLDPRIHLLAKMMDCRVKPGNDG
jgi:hypothetical protein